MMGAGRFFTIFTNHEPIDMPEELLNLGLSQRNRQTEDLGRDYSSFGAR
jgi:hypothetical protein